MTLTGFGTVTSGDAASPSMFKMYKRSTGQDAVTWGSSVGYANAATTGADGILSFNAPSVTSFSQFTIMRENVVLPLILTNFIAKRVEKDHAQLDWTTEQEANTAYFEIEKSNDGRHFEKIGTVKATGQATEKHTYSFKDVEILRGPIYYRLRMVDADGHFVYSNIQSLDFDKTVDVLVYPNPVGMGNKVFLKTNLEEPFEVTLSDVSGKTILIKTFTTPDARLDTEGVAKGIYLYELKSKTYWHFGKIVVE